MNPNQQFCLRWNNHQSTLISVFEALLESGTLVDCTLAAEGQYLKAHKVVLSACSPYLGMLLSQDFEKHPILILKDVKFAQLKSMLDYMYRGEVNISQDQLGTFLKAAESLQIKGLTDSGNANSNNSNNSGEDDYNARHRKHLALMAAAAARARSPIIEQQQQQHQHTRWMNNGGSMHEMMRDGSISPSPRRRKRPRRPSLGHNPLQNGHDDMPLQPLIQQAQATTNNVLAQSLAAPPLTHPPKCVSPPRPVTPPVIENHREEEEASSPSPKPQPMIEHNNNVNHLLLKQEKILNSSPDHKDNGVLTNNNNSNMNNNHSNSVDGGVSDDDGGSDNEERGERMKKDEAMEEENNEELEEEGEEDLDEDSRSAHVQGATMANAHWLMAEASLPNSDSFQDSKENDITKLWKSQHYLQSWDAWSAHYPSVPSLLQRAALSNSPPSPSGDKGVECPNCGRHYKLKSSLRNHQKWECGKEPQFQCPYCNYRAKQKMHVARHIERMHREKLGILEGGVAASPIASILPGANPQQTQTILQ